MSWIHDFPEGASNSKGGCANLLFGKICQTLHEYEGNWTGDVSLAPPLDPPIIVFDHRKNPMFTFPEQYLFYIFFFTEKIWKHIY